MKPSLKYSVLRAHILLVLFAVALGAGAPVAMAQLPEKARLGFATNYVVVNEGDGTARIDLIRRGNTNEAASATLTVRGTNPKHFVPTTNLVEFAAGETNRFVLVTLIDDELKNASSELAELRLQKPSANAAINVDPSTLVILDDDVATVRFKRQTISLLETNGPVAVELVRAGALQTEVRVRAKAQRNVIRQATLFTPATNEIVFPAGETDAVFLVPAGRDYAAKGNDVASLSLTALSANTTIEGLSSQLTLLDADSELVFSGVFSAVENAGTLTLGLLRQGSTEVPAEVDVVAEDRSARAGVDYEFTPVRLEFPVGVAQAQFTVKLLDDQRQQGGRQFTLRLANPVGVRVASDRVPFSIEDDETNSEPGGLSNDFATGGFDSFVNSVVRLADDRLLVGGWYKNYRGEPATNVVILLPDGSRDPGFNCAGPDNGFVDFAVPLAAGRALVTGFFSQFGGQPRSNAVVLESDGSVATDVRLDLDGKPSVVRALPDGRVVVAGDFISRLNDQPIPQVFRLTADGHLDASFVGGTNCIASPSSVLPLSDGTLYANGSWRGANGDYSSPVRLLNDGRPDPTFVGGTSARLFNGFAQLPDGTLAGGSGGRLFGNGAADPAYGDGTNNTLHLTLPDGRIIASRSTGAGYELVQLLADGTPADEPIARMDGSIYDLVREGDGTLTFVGNFTTVNGQSRGHIARVQVDEPAAPAQIRWHGRNFGGLAAAGLMRVPLLRTWDASVGQTVHFRTHDDTAKAGIDFEASEGDVEFVPGERIKLIELRLLNDGAVGLDGEFILELTGPGVEPREATARVTVLRDRGMIEFSADGQSLGESARGGEVVVTRTGGTAYPASVNLDLSGTATPVVSDSSNYSVADFSGRLPARLDFAPGEVRQVIQVSPRNDGAVEGSETLEFTLTGASSGFTIGTRARHTLTLLDDDTPFAPGENYWPGGRLFSRLSGGLWMPGGQWTATGWRPGPIALKEDGSVDPAIPPPAGPSGTLLGVYPDGRLLMGRLGSNPSKSCVFYRLLADNHPDPTFTEQNVVFTGQNGAGDWLEFDGQPTPDGGALVEMNVPVRGANTDGRLQLARFDANGKPVVGFVGSTVTTHGLLGSTPRVQLAVTSTGSILVAGQASAQTTGNPGPFGSSVARSGLFRLRPNGELDPSFRADLGGNQGVLVRRLVVLGDDRLLVAGHFDAINGVSRPGLARLWPDGTLDDSFAPVLPNPATDPDMTVVASAPDGQVFTSIPTASGYRVIRLRADGSLDAAFVTPEFNDLIVSMLALDDGRVVVTGRFDHVGGEYRSGYVWLSKLGALLPAMPMSVRSPAGGNGVFDRLTIEARFTGPATLERSVDLQQWQPVGDVNLIPGLNEVPVPPGDPASGFFRLRR